MQRTRNPSTSKLGFIAVALALLVLVWTFRDLDPATVGQLLSRVSPPEFVLLLLPQLLALVAETKGWRDAFAVLGRRVPYLALLKVRLSTEALAQTLPAGVVVCESVKPLLLQRACDVPVTEAVAGMAARKYLLLVAQSLYVTGMAALGFQALCAASRTLLGAAGLGWFVPLSGVALLIVAFSLRCLLVHGALAGRLGTLLARWPSRRLGRLVKLRAERFDATDGEIKRYFGQGLWRSNAPVGWFLIAWLLESLETFLILRVLGVELDFATVAAFEVALSLVRNLAFLLPAGLGLQDAGYVAFLGAVGVPDPLSVGAAFVLSKRSKEIFWACVGYGLLAFEPRRAQRRKLTALTSCTDRAARAAGS